MGLQGKVIFSSGLSSDFDLWRLDLESGTITQLTTGNDLYDFPRVSPDGSKIAYLSVQSDSILSLWVMNSDGSGKKRLTTDIHCQAPSWSPDGKRLIFCGNTADKNEMDVSVIAVEGGAASRLFIYSGVEGTPSFSPDGKRVLFSAPATDGDSPSRRDTEIIEYTIANGSFRTLCSHPSKDYFPSYSPDGKRIAFISHRNDKTSECYKVAFEEFKQVMMNGSNAEARAAMAKMKQFEDDGDVFVMDADGGNLVQLTRDSHADNGICWSPCGNFLMYTSAPGKNHHLERLKVIDARSGAPVELHYDRTPLEREIGTFQLLNRTFFQQLVPDSIERTFIDGSFWGEERHPHWVA